MLRYISATKKLKPPMLFAFLLSPLAVASGNQDERCVSSSENTVSVWSEGLLLKSTALGAWHVSVGDMDNDGDLDLIGSERIDDTVVVFYNDKGDFYSERVVTRGVLGTYASPIQTIPYDVDGDEDDDLVTVYSESMEIGWHENLLTGSFITRIVASLTTTPRSVGVGDVNLDGLPDVVVGGDGYLSWFENLGRATPLAPPSFREQVIATPSVTSLDLADIDSDGRLDVVVVGSSLVAIYFNDPNGFSRVTVTEFPPGSPTTIQGVDHDNDGLLDLLVAGDQVVVYHQTESIAYFRKEVLFDSKAQQAMMVDGELLVATSEEIRIEGSVVSTTGGNGVALADFDGDDDLDVAVAHVDDSFQVYFRDCSQIVNVENEDYSSESCACDDDPDWLLSSGKDCSWVGDSKGNRCIRKSPLDGVYAWQACQRGCHTCTPFLFSPDDDGSWHKKNSPSKNCEWVASFPESRCVVKGEDGEWGFERCPKACGLV